jgi:hypothetical protein
VEQKETKAEDTELQNGNLDTGAGVGNLSQSGLSRRRNSPSSHETQKALEEANKRDLDAKIAIEEKETAEKEAQKALHRAGLDAKIQEEKALSRKSRKTEEQEQTRSAGMDGKREQISISREDQREGQEVLETEHDVRKLTTQEQEEPCCCWDWSCKCIARTLAQWCFGVKPKPGANEVRNLLTGLTWFLAVFPAFILVSKYADKLFPLALLGCVANMIEKCVPFLTERVFRFWQPGANDIKEIKSVGACYCSLSVYLMSSLW